MSATDDRIGDGFALWVADAQAGDPVALGELLEGFRPYLLAVANCAVPDELRGKGGGSDLVQETFLEAHRDFGRFVGNHPEALRAWLRGILRNNLVDWARRFRNDGKRAIGREQPVPARLVDPCPTPGAQTVALEEAEALDAALMRLPGDEREVIMLRHRDHVPWEEVGRRLHRSAEAARKLRSRAITRMQRTMEVDPR